MCKSFFQRKINCIAPCKFKRFSKDKTDFFRDEIQNAIQLSMLFQEIVQKLKKKILFQAKKYPFCYVMRKNTYTAKIKMAYLIIGPCITALRSKLRTLQKAERGEGGRDVGKRDRGRAVQGSNGGVTGLCKAHC